MNCVRYKRIKNASMRKHKKVNAILFDDADSNWIIQTDILDIFLEDFIVFELALDKVRNSLE